MPSSDKSPNAAPRLERPATGPQTLLVDGEPFLMLAGEVHNSASGGPEVFDRACRRLKCLAGNTVLAPICWEMVEPEEGCFDFTQVDFLLEIARRHGLRLVPLWFGAYKNAMSTYAPGWVKADPKRFPRADLGRGGCFAEALSVFSPATRAADAAAFTRVMARLAESDADRRTAILVQVENEVGTMFHARDLSAPAERLFRAPPPADFLEALARTGLPLPSDAAGFGDARAAVDWAGVFGPAAGEVFMAWGFAGYLQALAAAGRRVYDLPMYANAWLVQYPGQPAGDYPSGGPVARMAAVWRATAPALDFLAPDIYMDDFAAVAAEYSFPGNALFIPESRRDLGSAARALYAFGRHDALGFAPFGVEAMIDDAPPMGTLAGVGAGAFVVAEDEAPDGESLPASAERLRRAYRLLGGLGADFHRARASGRVSGALQAPGVEAMMVVLGGYRLRFRWEDHARPADNPGGALVFSPTDGDFYFIGCGFTLDVLPPAGHDDQVEWLGLWEGEFIDGAWRPSCRLNGDEFNMRSGPRPRAYRLVVHRPRV